MLRFKVLGPLEISDGCRRTDLTAPKVRQLLALLLVRSNEFVQTDLIVRELWDDAPPNRVSAVVQTYVYQLRKALPCDGPGRQPVTRPSGYCLQTRPEQLDMYRFDRYAREGRRLLDEGQPDRASARLQQALDLWSGPFLADVSQGPLLAAHAVHFHEKRMRTLEKRISADMRRGAYRDLIGELRWLVASHPLDEWFHAHLIEALHRAGRRAGALQAYHHLRQLLRSELGVDPSPSLQRLHMEVLQTTLPAATRPLPGGPMPLANGSHPR